MLHCFEIDNNICNYCWEENNWEIEIENILRSKIREGFAPFITGLPANHPFWDFKKEIYSKYEVRCLTFTYDDMKISICKRHLEEFVRQF